MSHLFPGAVYLPVTDTRTDPRLDRVAGAIWHLSATEAPSLYRYFDGPSGGVESHLHVPREAKHATEQYRAGDREADANYRGNSWLVGSERWGFHSMEFQGADPAAGAYTDHQIEVGLAFCVWSQETYHWKRQVADSYRGQGIGYHVMWGAGAGLNAWSNARGKTCPGKPRIEQFYDVIVPRFLRQEADANLVVVKKPAPIIPVGVAPPFPLPRGCYFGPKEGPATSISGYYSHRQALRTWQQRMDVRGWRIDADGLYGPRTREVATLFQKQCGIGADGLIGPDTWRRAWTQPVT